jgi:hypothetical protein
VAWWRFLGGSNERQFRLKSYRCAGGLQQAEIMLAITYNQNVFRF